MSPELEKQLLERYPELYDYRDTEDCKGSMVRSYGFEHGDGWFNIVDSLSNTISELMKNHPAKKHLTPEEFGQKVQVRVAQVKEKFGCLRYYVDNPNPEVSAAIFMAERLSSRTCETCGSPGKLMNGRWVRTLCEGCEKNKTKKE